jgi:hypothetical protein
MTEKNIMFKNCCVIKYVNLLSSGSAVKSSMHTAKPAMQSDSIHVFDGFGSDIEPYSLVYMKTSDGQVTS